MKIPPAINVSLFLLLTATAFLTSSHAGVITQGVATDDASTGISTSKTYTAAVYFGYPVTSGLEAINGVVFTAGGNDLNNYGPYTPNPSSPVVFTTTGVANQAGGWYAVPAEVDGLGHLQAGQVYNTTDSVPLTDTLTLTGLTLGYSYQFRVYLNSAVVNLSFNDGSGTPTQMANFSTTVNSLDPESVAYLNYDFTASSTSLVVTFDETVPMGNTYFFGVTNEITAVPEPSSSAMLLIGIGFCFYRSRKKTRLSA